MADQNFRVKRGLEVGIGATVLTALSSGNLGIGTTNPNQLLDVFGNIVLGDNGTSPARIARRNTDSYLVVGNGGNISGGAQTTGANIELYGSTHATAAGRAFYDALNHNFRSLDSSVITYASISTSTSYFNNVVQIGSATSTGTASQPLQVTGGAYVSGSVGIGSTNPTAKLDVRGKTLLWNQPNVGYAVTKGDMDTYAVLKLRGHATDSTNMQFAHVNNGNSMGVQVTNSLNTANWDILLNPFGGNIGIGTTNPGATLNVVPASTSIAGLFSGTTSSDMVRITQLGTGNALVVEDSANPDSTPFVVTAGGAVGVGTTNPVGRLHVDVLSDGSDAVYTTSNNVNGSIILRPDGTNGNQLRYGGSGTNANVLRFVGVADVEYARFNNSGNLGIGTTNPTSSKVEVWGSGSPTSSSPLNNAIRIYTTSSTGSGSQLILNSTQITSGKSWALVSVGSTTGGSNIPAPGSFIINDNSLDIPRLVINPSGSIGIGTTNPTSLFQVQGNTLVSGVSTITTRLNVGIAGSIVATTSDGLVGFGTTNPTAGLHIVSTDTIDSFISKPSLMLSAQGSAGQRDNAAFYLYDSNNLAGNTTATLGVAVGPSTIGDSLYTFAFSKKVFEIDEDGKTNIYGNVTSNNSFISNVQIDAANSTNSVYITHQILNSVYQYSSAGKIIIWNTPVSIENSGGSSDLSVSGITTTLRLNVGTGGTVITTTSTGLVGFGTTNPTAKLQVQGNTNINNTLPFTVSYGSSFSVGSQETTPQEIEFSNDGRTMYVIGSTGDDITWYTLSTPWNITTASHVSQFSVSAQTTAPTGLTFKPDGTKFYITGTTGPGGSGPPSVNEYFCRTPWDLTTVGHTTSYSVLSQTLSPHDIEFNTDGTQFYILDDASNFIQQYACSTPWSVASDVSVGSSFSVGSQESAPTAFAFSQDGTKLLLTGSNGDDINYYTLSSPWNIATVSFVGIITSVGSATTLAEINPSGLYWKPDGTKLYLTGTTKDTVWEFNVTSNAQLEVTGKTRLYGDVEIYENLDVYGEQSNYENAYFYNKVGIGTTNPTVALQLSPNASISNVGSGITLAGTVGSALTVAQFYYANINASYLRIKATRLAEGANWTTASTKLLQVTDVTEQGYIEYNPNGANYGMAFGSGATEWARFLLSGNLGIGITNPGSDLQVAGAAAGIRLTDNTGAVGDLSSTGWLLYQRPSNFGESPSGLSIQKDSGSSALTINSSNNIGIGIDNPVGQLQVSSGPVIIGAATSTGTASQNLQVTGGAYVSTRLGIGTTNPVRNLHVVGSGTSTSHLFVSGVSTSIDTRIHSVAEKSTLVSGNTVNLVYNTGGGNVAICTNPTGPITLNVAGIPTDSSFDNRAISFAVIVQQGTTAYACTTVTLNGVTFGANAPVGVQTQISYSFGIVATGSTSGYDVFNFTGINTIGSASTTLNYKILSNVNGDYRRY